MMALFDPVVIYHGGCLDGFTAAWAARRALGPDTRTIPMGHGKPIPEGVDDRDVYVVDFSYPRAELTELADRARSLTVLDHHATAKDDLEGFEHPNVRDIVFDMERSGAGITWDYFQGPDDRPSLVNYVEDSDLWRFRLRNSGIVRSYLRTLVQTFEVWDLEMARPLDEIFEVARGAHSYLQAYIRALVPEKVELIDCFGWTAGLVNAPYIGISEVLNGVVDETEAFQVDIGLGWQRQPEGNLLFSVRSKHGQARPIAEKLGGGGHPNAAGFRWPGTIEKFLIEVAG